MSNKTPPLQGRGLGWGRSGNTVPLDSPHPIPSPEGEGLTIRTVVADAAARLSETSATPRLDAELLMAHALGVTARR
jgi:hypothetical protein